MRACVTFESGIHQDVNRPVDAADEWALPGLAREHGLTTYDAAYLNLAVRAGIPVATLDRLLAKAVRAEGLLLVGE